MSNKTLHMVTGAFGFSGKYIASELISRGKTVTTLTNSPGKPHTFGNHIKALPFNFSDHTALVRSLQSVSVLYNTYWVRFNYGDFSYQQAVDNSLHLFRAAQEAGVEKIVHTSITNPSLNSELEYFRGKAMLEEFLLESEIPCSILRPAVIFGPEDILINNIAWILRKMPLVPMFGYGSYRIQPVFVKDFAELAADEGRNRDTNIINAVGQETYTYRQLIEKIGDIIGVSKPILRVSPGLGYTLGVLIGKMMGDIVVTRDEITGLMADLLHVQSPPTGKTKLSTWARENSTTLGHSYANELQRRSPDYKV